jgi:hypothetical protein
MKQFKIVILLVATSMLLCACPDKGDGHRYITIVNQSDKTIVWQPRFFKIGEIDEKYDCQYTLGSIHSNLSFKFNYDDRGNTWEAGLNSHYLQITVMDDSAFIHYAEILNYKLIENCDTIRKYVPILHTYRLTLADLQRMNWTVVYPPEE